MAQVSGMVLLMLLVRKTRADKGPSSTGTHVRLAIFDLHTAVHQSVIEAAAQSSRLVGTA